MVCAASPEESTLSDGFFERTEAAVTRWVGGAIAPILRLASLTRRIAPVLIVVLQLKRSPCFRKYLAFPSFFFAHFVGTLCGRRVGWPACRHCVLLLSTDVWTVVRFAYV